MSRVRRDHPRCRSASWICMCDRTRDVVIFQISSKSVQGVWSHGGGRNLPFPITLAIGFYHGLYSSTSRDKISYCPGGGNDMPPRRGSSTPGGSTSVRGRVRSPHMAQLQAVSVPIAQGSCALRAAAPWDRRADGAVLKDSGDESMIKAVKLDRPVRQQRHFLTSLMSVTSP